MSIGKRSILGFARSIYGHLERPISSLSLIGGFVFDAFTLTRVDIPWDNIWVAAHLAVVTVCVIWINLLNEVPGENGVQPEADPHRLRFWLVNLIQFAFGGLLSVFLVFYFRSGTIWTSWPFLLMLALAFIANEFLKRRYARLSFQMALLFLALYAFAIYMMPILLHRISSRVFLMSGIASVAAIAIVLLILAVFSRRRFRGRSGWATLAAIAGILVIVNGLYFVNLIPPLPLSLKEANIYHSLSVKGPGNYTATGEHQTTDGFASIGFIRRFFSLRQTIHIKPGDALTFYSAVFCPSRLTTEIVHEWQHYDQSTGEWTTRAVVHLPVVGGREEGYRTFSRLPSITSGLWRVDVETPGGLAIGRFNFRVVMQPREPTLQTETIH